MTFRKQTLAQGRQPGTPGSRPCSTCGKIRSAEFFTKSRGQQCTVCRGAVARLREARKAQS